MNAPLAAAPARGRLMTPRMLAVATFGLGAAALYAFLLLLGFVLGAPAPLRLLREGKQRVTAPARPSPATFADFRALPHTAPLAEVRALQSRGVVVEGRVQRMLWAGDGDLHLELVDAARGPTSPDTTYVTAEITPRWRGDSHGWSYEALVAALRPNHGGGSAWDAGPARVRLTGWLLFDFQYDRVPSSWALQHQSPRLTGWEIHPVTRVERWDEAAGTWREIAR